MRLIDEGALTEVRAAVALHTRRLPAGSIGVTAGPALAGNDTTRIAVRGERLMPRTRKRASTPS